MIVRFILVECYLALAVGCCDMKKIKKMKSDRVHNVEVVFRIFYK